MRQAIGVEKIALFGVSYGTKLALAYAARYPAAGRAARARLGRRADRSRRLLAGEPRRDPARAADALPARAARTSPPTRSRTSPRSCSACARAASLYGPLVSAQGRRHRARIGSVRLLDLLYRRATSTPRCAPTSRGAVRSALDGRPGAPAATRAARGARGQPGSGRVPQRRAVRGDRLRGGSARLGAHDAGRGTRAAAAKPRSRALPAAALDPFDRTTALFASPTVQLCSRWPSAPAEPAIQDGPFPAVPTVVLAGEDDLRTPLESARRVAARIPGATLVPVPEMGHSVLDGFPRTCGLRTVDDFFSDRPLRRCPPRRREFPPVPMAPALAVRGARRSRASADGPGRTVFAVGAHADRRARPDLLRAALIASPDQDVVHVGGLRAGYARAGLRTPRAARHGVRARRARGISAARRAAVTRGPRGVLRVTGRCRSRGTARASRGTDSVAGTARRQAGARRAPSALAAGAPRVHRVAGLGSFISVGRSLDQAIERVKRADELGYDSAYVTHIAGRDSLTLLMAYAAATENIKLGHRRAADLLAHAGRDRAAGRHDRRVLRRAHGARASACRTPSRSRTGTARRSSGPCPRCASTSRPCAPCSPATTCPRASSSRPTSTSWATSRAPTCPIYVAALSPNMLQLAGEVADGVMLWLCNPSYIRDVVMPEVRPAASAPARAWTDSTSSPRCRRP